MDVGGATVRAGTKHVGTGLLAAQAGCDRATASACAGTPLHRYARGDDVAPSPFLIAASVTPSFAGYTPEAGLRQGTRCEPP